MQPGDIEVFRETIQGVHSFYGKDVSAFAIDVWWQALKPYDLDAVRDALGRHCVNPDTGQFLPRPADVVKMLEGTTLDAAVVAWSKVDRAVQAVGTYASVVFDDPLIHAVLDDMGGWVPLGKKSIDEWPFVAKEFQTRYRGYKLRRETPVYPSVLIGIIDGENGQHGFALSSPTLIGNPLIAKRVMSVGTNQPRLTITRGAAAAALLELNEEQASNAPRETEEEV